MKIEWIEDYNKPCGEIKTPKNFPVARMRKEDDDISDLMEYNSQPNRDGYIWLQREREGSLNFFEKMRYHARGYSTVEEMIMKKYNLGRRYFEIKNIEFEIKNIE